MNTKYSVSMIGYSCHCSSAFTNVALHKLDGYPYDYHRLLYSFRVKSRTQDAGIYRPRHSWEFGGGVSFKERVSTP